ncbi:hypothetical protein P4H66_19520 [Paenibacillus dokdonensis]|uniref:Phage ABA sandwich domain-containing protein n=1 Tax=Paenibacillus dokdonensis TaxID=2567944 RepID=A0ABU6GQG2_9BACL|nr:hypothetical protein [Paenibacillus dokdonensis]MEC0241996.1 hypothetical protein [Paenibacillus dokdonensis]
MTREEIMALEPGRELDAMIAEALFGWRKIKGPQYDYDGPCESNDVLLPPTITSEEEAFRFMPPRGVIPYTYFLNHKWSTDISAAWEVVEKMCHESLAFSFRLDYHYVLHFARFIHNDSSYELEDGEYKSRSAPEAICKAALLAVMDKEA